MPRTFALRHALPFASLLLALGLATDLRAQFGPDPRGGTSVGSPGNIFPLAPRELRQYLTRAQAAVAEQRFSDAVQELSQILNSNETDDFFLSTPGGGETAVSLKTQALELLGSMPARGRKFYELQCGVDAKQALEEALNAGDLTRLTEIGRRFFHTKAGYEATLILGRVQLDQGHPIAAALTLKRIADVPQAAADYDPELSVLLATCWLYANQAEKAEETLVALKQRQPQGKIRLTDKEVPLFDGGGKPLDWLARMMGGPRTALLKPAMQWAVYRGDEKRNASSLGGLPLMNFSWKVPTVNDPPDFARVAQLFRSARDKSDPLLCSLQPLVVQDYAILRQPESGKLVGINLKKGGKREWVFPPFDESASGQTAQQIAQISRSPTANIRENELKQRIWEDHTFGQISSDGRQVYLIHDLGFADPPNMTRPQVLIGRGGRGVFNSSGAKPHNVLVALDLAKQGYRVWEVGGTTAENPELMNAFFLGPPLPSGDQLYALAEFAGEIRLVCLNSRTGKLEWRQPLAVLLEQLHIVNDRSRRLAGASPSLADGILVCPTSAGSVVAIDLPTRTLRWGYQYGRTDVRLTTQSRFGAPMAEDSSDNGRWLDSTATLAEGCVVLTPPESNQLHVLDLLTGTTKWPPQPRDEMLFVACVHKGKIILVGKDRMKAVNLSDGAPTWKSDLALGGESCAGRGYYNDKFYYVPVTGQRLLKIDLDDGQVVGSVQTDLELGNLVCYQNELISQSPLSVASFVLMSDQLQRELDERLAANQADVGALSLKAQILLQAEKADESLNLLRQAQKLAPDSAAVRGLLVKVMLALLQNDFDSNSSLADELDKLVTDPRERRDVLRWRIQGLARANRSDEAFRAILELADQELALAAQGAPNLELISINRGEQRVRMDRWLQGNSLALWRAADSETQTRMAEELAVRQKRVIASGSAGQLRSFLNLFGFHPLAAATRLALADHLLRSESWLEAELVVGEMLSAADRATAGGARARLAAIYERSKRPELAARRYQELANSFGDVVCRGELTGQALAKQAAENPAFAPYFGAIWPRGKVEVSEHEAPNQIDRGFVFQQMVATVPIGHHAGAAISSLRVNYDQQNNMLVVRGEFGQPLTMASLRSADRRVNFAGGGIAHLSATANGHLILVNMGTEVVAVDGLRSSRNGESLLWRQETIDLDPLAQRVISPLQRTSSNPLTGGRQVSYERDRKVSFQVAPARGIGFCFQRGRQLICVDPLTGQSLWERGPIPAQAEIFGDDEYIFVGTAESRERLVLRAVDGALVETKKIVDAKGTERAEYRWTTHGRRVLTWEQSESTSPVKLRLYDAWSGAELWSSEVKHTGRGFIIDGDELALLEADGKFSIVSLADGKSRLLAQLEPESTLTWIQVLRSKDQYVLLASQEYTEPGNSHTQPIGTANSQLSKMHGRVLAFDRATGKAQWPVPAFVSQHCLPADQPVESPLLFFVRNRYDSNRPAGSKASILALDRRDGRIVYENDSSTTPAQACDITMDPAKRVVALTLLSPTSKLFAFQFTDKPQPPEPPAQTGALSSLTVGEPRGVLDRAVGAALDLLPRGLLPTRRPQPGPNP